MRTIRNKNHRRAMGFLLSLAMVMSPLSSYMVSAEEITATNRAAVVEEQEMISSVFSFTEAAGYKEGAYAEWTAVEGADGYVAYVSKDGSAWTELDDQLIRKYPSNYRVDALGLTAGNWSLKVEAVTLDSSMAVTGVISTATAENLTVTNYDRTGFCFSTESRVNPADGIGAYNADGSLKDGAQVIYVTAATAKTVKATLHTDTKGNTAEFTGLQAILTGKQKVAANDDILDIRLIGKISDTDLDSMGSSTEGLLVKGKDNYSNMNITIEGVGEDAAIHGFGIQLTNCSNSELRNFAVMNFMDDGISVNAKNSNLWFHNLEFYYGKVGSASDQAKGDGSLDIKDDSQYITVSYNRFVDSGKCSLCGMKSESGPNYITYHHNWFEHSDSRHPRIRTMSVHLYNNYFDGNSKYGVGAAMNSSAFVESNYFRNVKYPMMSSEQGSDRYSSSTSQNDKGTFSGENSGIIKAYDNYLEGSYTLIPYGAETYWKHGVETAFDLENTTSTVDFDAYVVADRNETVPESVTGKVGGSKYTNFDTTVDTGVTAAQIDPAEDVKEIVMAEAGTLGGSVIAWEHEEATADESDVVDTALKAEVTGYTSTLVSVGGREKASTTVTYTVTFDPNNGESSTQVQVSSGSRVADPGAPSVVPDGKQFNGWYRGTVKWNFNNAVSSNMTLTANWITIGDTSDGDTSGGDTTGGDTPIGPLPDGTTAVGRNTVIYDITKDGLTNPYFAVSGNLKSSEGTSGTYNNTTYTGKGLKMENSTTIDFTITTKKATLVMVFESGFAKKVKVGVLDVANPSTYAPTVYSATAGVAEVALTQAASYRITKGDSTQLYAIYVIPDGSNPGSNPGGDVSGGDVSGGDVSGGDVSGGDVSGGDVSGGDVSGGDVSGGDIPPEQKGLHVTLKKPGEVYVYTGSAIKPEIIVTNNGKALKAGVDYTVKYSNNVNSSYKNPKKITPAKITVTGKGNLTGSQSTTFVIQQKNINDSDVIKNQVTDGNGRNNVVLVAKGTKLFQIAPVMVYNDKKLTTADYTRPQQTLLGNVAYNEDGEIIISGKGNFTGSCIYKVKVVAKNELKKFNVAVDTKTVLTYNGMEQVPRITVTDSKDKSIVLENGVDYKLDFGTYSKVNAGTVKFTVIGIGAYTGSVAKSYRIKPIVTKDQMSVNDISAEHFRFTASGVTVNDKLQVKYRDTVLTEGKDYKITYANNKKISTAKAPAKFTVSFLGNYKGSTALTGTFQIDPAPLSKEAGIKVTVADQIYTKPNLYKSVPFVTIGGELLKSNNYTVTYYKDADLTDQITSANKVTLADNEVETTIWVKITGKGNYDKNDYVKKSYKVKKRGEATVCDLSKARVTIVDKDGNKISRMEYTGLALEPDVKVEVKVGKNWVPVDKQLYRVSYVNNVKKGTATIVVTGKDTTCVGSKTVKFSIVSKNIKGISDFLKDLFSK